MPEVIPGPVLDPPEKITTNELAVMFGCKPDSIRHSLCIKGHYMGIVPTKLPNRRLMWSRKKAREVLGG